MLHASGPMDTLTRSAAYILSTIALSGQSDKIKTLAICEISTPGKVVYSSTGILRAIWVNNPGTNHTALHCEWQASTMTARLTDQVYFTTMRSREKEREREIDR